MFCREFYTHLKLFFLLFVVDSDSKRNIMEIDFDKLFKVMIFAMRMNRSHPDIPRDKKWVMQFVLMHGTFFIIFCLLIYSVIYHDLRNNDFTQACSNGVLCVVFSVVTFKYCVMLRYQNLLKVMIDTMKADFQSATELSTEDQKIVLQYAQRGKRIINMWLWISICTAGLFPLKTFALMFYYKIIGKFKFVHLYDLTYPSVIEDIKNEPGPYALLYIVFLFYDIYAMFMYIAFASLGPIFMLHVCGQLELVRKTVLEIFLVANLDSEQVLKKLQDVALRLQKIYSFVEKIKESFKVLYELTLKATTVIIPITFHQVIQSFHNGEISLEFITIIFGAMTLSSIPCYYSDMLMEMGENVRLAFYTSGWEKHWDRRTRSVLLIILVRAVRPIAVRAMFRTVSLDALTDVRTPVFHHSYAIFNVLNVAWK